MTCKCKPIYAERNHMKQGNHYAKHVCHMTAEGLHDKSEIAGELAHRDIVIERQQAEIGASEITHDTDLKAFKKLLNNYTIQSATIKRQQEALEAVRNVKVILTDELAKVALVSEIQIALAKAND